MVEIIMIPCYCYSHCFFSIIQGGFMRTLIVGGSGMLGYQLLTTFQAAGLEVSATLRNKKSCYENSTLDLQRYRFFDEIDIMDLSTLRTVFDLYQPQLVINATRYKPNGQAKNYLQDVEITALFPLQLGELCEHYNAHLIHISTNCVFSGDKQGLYVEEDTPDALDLYGKCKSIAEGVSSNSLVLRTSIIGYEHFQPRNMVNWFLSQNDNATGFTKALFNGLTVAELSRVILMLAKLDQPLSGIWHIASDTISKFDIISQLAKKLKINISVIPDHQKKHSVLLCKDKFAAEFHYVAPNWEAMLDELAAEIASSVIPLATLDE